MALRLYDTLTKQKREFVPIDPSNVRMYVCGPTVYDFAHIGNARPVIVFDVLFRLLRHLYGETHVKYVRNITDVDDKINDRASRDFPGLPLNEAIRKVTEQTEKQFHADVDVLGCLRPTGEPRATEHIAEMREIIERLVKGGFAYVAADHVLFSPQAMNAANSILPRYGALANRSLDEMIAGARVDVAPYKRDATDFVLWKPSKPGEPSWPSPAGISAPGRPGWHIECSAMAWKHLGEKFDIHGGGIDLVFPHHENELAQSCCAFHADRMAETWMHNGFLQVEGEKMSKSLGNFVTIRELLDSDKFGGHPWHGAALRFVMLQTHYRQPIDWTIEKLRQARTELFTMSLAAGNANSVAQFASEQSSGQPQPIDREIVEALCDDLNTSAAITRLRALTKDARTDASAAKKLLGALKFLGIMDERSIHYFMMTGPITDISVGNIVNQRDDGYTIERLRVAQANNRTERVAELRELIEGWGVDLRFLADGTWSIEKKSGRQDSTIQDLIEARTAARARKDFKESDRIRDELAAMGIAIKDGKDADGKPVTTWEIAR
ncbi:MAG: cysteine--tRNA ligase [Rhodopseudomonas sp.]|nr:cysteine--tRNA ligase [Rhodopseudomonas sp.]NVN86906.1 cysteine--tRNA ligase [Rhodopseudomonas sp.]